MERRVVTVFGGSGFIGRHFVRRLAAEGAVVRVAARDPEAALFLKPLGDPGQIVPLAARVDDAPSVARAVAGAAEVVNLAGVLAPWGRQTFQRVHADGARLVAEAAAAAGVRRLVQMSAIGADPASPSEYARTKAAGEEAARAAFPGATVVRPGLVFGPEDRFFNLFAGMARVLPALPLIGGGATRFQPVHVLDVAAALVRILADPATAGRTFELGGPRTYSFRDLLLLTLDQIRRPRALIPVPFGIVALQAWFIEKLPGALLTRDQVRLLRRDCVVAEGAEGFRELGIEPTALEAVLPTYLARFRPQALQE